MKEQKIKDSIKFILEQKEITRNIMGNNSKQVTNSDKIVYCLGMNLINEQKQNKL